MISEAVRELKEKELLEVVKELKKLGSEAKDESNRIKALDVLGGFLLNIQKLDSETQMLEGLTRDVKKQMRDIQKNVQDEINEL